MEIWQNTKPLHIVDVKMLMSALCTLWNSHHLQKKATISPTQRRLEQRPGSIVTALDFWTFRNPPYSPVAGSIWQKSYHNLMEVRGITPKIRMTSSPHHKVAMYWCGWGRIIWKGMGKKKSINSSRPGGEVAICSLCTACWSTVTLKIEGAKQKKLFWAAGTRVRNRSHISKFR